MSQDDKGESTDSDQGYFEIHYDPAAIETNIGFLITESFRQATGRATKRGHRKKASIAEAAAAIAFADLITALLPKTPPDIENKIDDLLALNYTKAAKDLNDASNKNRTAAAHAASAYATLARLKLQIQDRLPTSENG